MFVEIRRRRGPTREPRIDRQSFGKTALHHYRSDSAPPNEPSGNEVSQLQKLVHIVRAFTDAEHTSVAYQLRDPVSTIGLERAGIAVGQRPRGTNCPFSECGILTDGLRRG